MADAQSLQTDISGVTANGMPEPWRAVLARHPRNIGDIASFVPNFSASTITGFNAASFALRQRNFGSGAMPACTR
mgnify:CR=1 FL=1